MKISDVEKIDRFNLKNHYTKLYTLKFPWGDQTFIDTLVKHSCIKTIENMDSEQYFNDIRQREKEEDEF